MTEQMAAPATWGANPADAFAPQPQAAPVAPAIPANVLALLARSGLPQDRSGVLKLHERAKTAIQDATAFEMELRKLVVALYVEKETAKEGVNNVVLDDGSTLKATLKFNYNLVAQVGKDLVDTIDDTIDEMARADNEEGTFIAGRMFLWKVDISVAEYKKLVEDAKQSVTKKALLALVNKVLSISDAAPTLKIVEPKGTKK